MKINFKDNKTRLILFFMITGWLRILILVIPGVWIYMNTGEWREQTNTEQTSIKDFNNTINSTNDNIPTLKIEQGD